MPSGRPWGSAAAARCICVTSAWVPPAWPRRKQLLEQLGVAYKLLLPDDDEDAESLELVLPGEAPLRYVQRVTQLKLDAALLRQKKRGWPSAPVLCSDTTVALGRSILGKPADRADAQRILQALRRGSRHRSFAAPSIINAVDKRLDIATLEAAYAGA